MTPLMVISVAFIFVGALFAGMVAEIRKRRLRAVTDTTSSAYWLTTLLCALITIAVLNGFFLGWQSYSLWAS